MINKRSFSKVSERYKDSLVLKSEEEYLFSNIFNSIKRLFGESENTLKNLPLDTINNYKSKPNKVLFFLVDAFSYEFYDLYKDDFKSFKTIEKEGVVSKLLAQFPSSTTGEITTALTNMPVHEHGIYEWFYYEKFCDNNITAFLFKETESDIYENLANKGIKPEDFLPKESFFKELKSLNVKSNAYQPNYINDSTYSKYMFRYAKLNNYKNYDELFKMLETDLRKDGEKEYYYVYIPNIDSIGHKYGPKSLEFKLEINKFFKEFDKFFINIKDLNLIDIIISADHGQIEADLSKMIYLDKEVKNIERFLKRNKKGDVYSPCGYVRDLFLHVKEEKLEELKDILSKNLKDRALVFTIDELSGLGVFPYIGDRFYDRVGNLIIIPLDNNTVWMYESFNQKGVHGGLSKSEMEIPFLYYSK